MKKVKCANGHFFDADRFSTCPICGMAAASEVPGEAPAAFPPSFHTTPLLTPAGMDDSASAPGIPPTDDSPYAPSEEALPHDPAAGPAGIFSAQANYLLKEGPEKPFDAAWHPLSGPPGPLNGMPTESEPPAASLSAAIEATASQKIGTLPKTTAYYDFNDVEPPVGWLVCLKGVYAGRAFPCKTGRNRVGRAPGMDVCLPDDPSISRDSHAIITYEPKQRVFFLQSGPGDGLIYHNGNYLFDHAELQAYDKIELGNAEFLFLPLCGERFTWDEYMKKGMV